jgi:ergothioneine biosynthesis protein EgtB
VGLSREGLLRRYREIRSFTVQLCDRLKTEDYVVQSMPDASPVKWHLGHTTWFFETFVLTRADTGYVPIDERYAFLFNSYYRAAGDRQPQAKRGVLSRPTVAEILAYRLHVDDCLERFLAEAPADTFRGQAFAIELGLHHEQQHQELILTDLKHAFAQNPLEPSYLAALPPAVTSDPVPLAWTSFDGGLVGVGHAGDEFAFDNERPRHRAHLEPFWLANRPATCGEMVEFIEDGGYRRPELWLSDGWDAREAQGWEAPLYWRRSDGAWSLMTLAGCRQIDLSEPLCHVSYYEADAFARWAGASLPSEEEWELAAAGHEVSGNFVESGRLHPFACASTTDAGVVQLYGDVWEWTASAYHPYPAYSPFPGMLGEYNGKFMSGRMVLRGGSCVSAATHLRPTYRNFFLPDARWQFSGVRLCKRARQG